MQPMVELIWEIWSKRMSKEKYLALRHEALVKFDDGDLEEALRLIESAITLNPKNLIDLILKASLLRELRRFDEAQQFLQSLILSVEPNHFIWVELARVHYDQGDFRQAASHFLVSLDFKVDKKVLTMLANAQLVFDPVEAERNSKKALDIDPNWEEARVINCRAKKMLEMGG